MNSVSWSSVRVVTAWRWSEAGAPAASYEQRQVHANTYPPIRTGMRGSHEGAFRAAHLAIEALVSH
jgi:hypothetical protein